MKFRGEYMKVTFEVRTVREQWQPPFKKESKTEQYTVDEGDYFLPVAGKDDDFVFRVLNINPYGVLVEYDCEYMPRTFDVPGNRQLRLGFGSENIFCAKWSHNGIVYYVKPVGQVTENAQSNGTEMLVRNEEGILEATEEEPRAPTNAALPLEDSVLENLK